MLAKINKILTLLLVALIFGSISGCYIDASDDTDEEPPAVPRGVRTITGDEQVIIEWYPNGEYDLAGYQVWRGRDDTNFDSLAEVSENATRYIDTTVRNGETYYYAVSAYDIHGNESELSPEDAWDTPRPEGRNITLDDYNIFPERSGFDFSRPEKGSVRWDTPATDVYFAFDADRNATYLYSDNETFMQDLGYHETLDAVDMVPKNGYVELFVELIEGHVYAINTPDNNFAKIHVRALYEDAVVFDWAYQTDPGNVQLAPSLKRP